MKACPYCRTEIVNWAYYPNATAMCPGCEKTIASEEIIFRPKALKIWENLYYHQYGRINLFGVVSLIVIPYLLLWFGFPPLHNHYFVLGLAALWLSIPIGLALLEGTNLNKQITYSGSIIIRFLSLGLTIYISILAAIWLYGISGLTHYNPLWKYPIGNTMGWVVLIAIPSVPAITNNLTKKLIRQTNSYQRYVYSMKKHFHEEYGDRGRFTPPF